ncbi:MAG: sn-glycerol-1-phosphate dehydrogenase [Propionibacteriaceae bacterium]|jgi:glycerol-1-phosphate dehydrogenase [NAD(P)+]|nr:sn-glycerol-1-phosphate dehydrogenase [Propionibacteriaceae bacterium]
MSRIASVLALTEETKDVLMGSNVVQRTGAVFARNFPFQRAVIVADGNTWAEAGETVRASLQAEGVATDQPVIYPGQPVLFADDAVVEDLRARLADTNAVACSIGSGSLNDVVKLASHQVGRSYLSVCTAASVDGYTSSTAAVAMAGVKRSVPCPAPRAVVVPLDLMATAPSRMTATGYGDLAEKIPAGADWMIADALGVESIGSTAWAIVQKPARGALFNSEGLARGEIGAFGQLAEALIMSGLGMQVYGSSRPAAGAGHYFSHQWEMEGYGRDWDPPLSHGFKVGLGTVAMCAAYEKLLEIDLADFDVAARAAAWPTPEEDEARVRALQPVPVIQADAVAQSAAKHVAQADAADWLDHIRTAWPGLRERVAQQVRPAAEIAAHLARIGAIWHPSQIGVSPDELKLKYFQAQTLRTRYTALDVLHELGLLETVVEGLFRPGGYWFEAPVPRAD